MKKIRWSDFSLVSKIMIEVGVLAVLLFSINMLFLCADQQLHAGDG